MQEARQLQAEGPHDVYERGALPDVRRRILLGRNRTDLLRCDGRRRAGVWWVRRQHDLRSVAPSDHETGRFPLSKFSKLKRSRFGRNTRASPTKSRTRRPNSTVAAGFRANRLMKISAALVP